MEQLFAMVLTVFTATGGADFVIDYDMTEYDCLQLVVSWDATIEDKDVAHVSCMPQA